MVAVDELFFPALAARAGSDAMYLGLEEQHAPPLFESEVPAVEFKRLEARTRKATPLKPGPAHDPVARDPCQPGPADGPVQVHSAAAATLLAHSALLPPVRPVARPRRLAAWGRARPASVYEAVVGKFPVELEAAPWLMRARRGGRTGRPG